MRKAHQSRDTYSCEGAEKAAGPDRPDDLALEDFLQLGSPGWGYLTAARAARMRRCVGE